MLEDGCNISGDKTKPYSIDIAMTGESTMSMTGAELDLSCTLTDMSYACDDEVDVQDYTSKGADVVLTTTFSYSGAFSDAQTGGLLYTIVADCEGADCGQLEKDFELTLPCTSAASTELTFSG
ncbi:MAG: hypothetical protein ACI8S6_005834 [Myxococcota bacterium]|jgi:hypothetical protein